MTVPITTAPGTSEAEWLANSLAQSIANLGYPVGLGVSPTPDHCQKAADALLAHFHERDSVRDAATLPALQEHASALAEALAGVMPYVHTGYSECHGDKCRQLNCASCFGEECASEHADKSNAAEATASQALAAYQATKP